MSAADLAALMPGWGLPAAPVAVWIVYLRNQEQFSLLMVSFIPGHCEDIFNTHNVVFWVAVGRMRVSGWLTVEER